MENENLDLDVKPAGNKDLWLFLIILDIVFLCVFGFFLYKHFSARLFEAQPAPRAEEVATVEVPELAATLEVTATPEPVAAPVTESAPVAEPVEIPLTAVLEEPKTAAKEEVNTTEAAQPEKATTDKKESVIVKVNPKSSKYRQVTFRWFGEGEKVAVVSGFTMAKPQALKKHNGVWETTLSIAPGTYKFLYVVDGKNTVDPYAEQQDGRSILVVK